VSSPVAGHALRELESIVRQTLASPMEATLRPSPEALAMPDDARGQLHALGFTKTQIEDAIEKGHSVPMGEMRRVEKIDQNGLKTVEWIGQRSFVEDFKQIPRRVLGGLNMGSGRCKNTNGRYLRHRCWPLPEHACTPLGSRWLDTRYIGWR
jgi:hypothetical protein